MNKNELLSHIKDEVAKAALEKNKDGVNMYLVIKYAEQLKRMDPVEFSLAIGRNESYKTKFAKGLKLAKIIKERGLNENTNVDNDVELIADGSKAYFFSTSTLKLTLMSFCTPGLYRLLWFYKNWCFIKERTDDGIMPFWRSFFSNFWAYSCFKEIKNSATSNSITENSPIVLLAIMYFILQALWRLPDPYWLVSMLSFTVLIPVNRVALLINHRLVNNYVNNDKYSGWNWAALILGGFSLLGTIYYYLPPRILKAVNGIIAMIF